MVKASEGLSDGDFALVNDEVIPARQYLDAFREGVRETFYHGKVTEKELDNFRDTVAQKLVDETLLVQQAKKLGIKPDPDQVAKEIEKDTARYRKQQNWEKGKDAIIASVRPKIEINNTIEQLKQRTQNVAELSVAEIRKYYEQHADQFTAPEKWNVSIILLKVEPSSPSTAWQEASELAEDLVRRLRDGENFEELARIHSGDESAVEGGNMGYIHTGMLSRPAQDVLNTMELGQISEPVMILQGVAIFRLNGIQGSKLNEFDNVKDRAKELLQRKLGDEAWENLITTLRKNAKIEINDKVVKSATTGPRPQT
ncbi:MAG: peptidylprolyl isomerase [Gammaproteobacteria bacterium]|nr:peptidylprolyl isomerase [Gammaproteobacteria bacterium]